MPVFATSTPSSVVSQTRPDNTTAYIIGDVWGDGTDARWTFDIPSGVRYSPVMEINVTAFVPNTGGASVDYRLFLMSAQPAAIGDNSAMSLSEAERSTILRPAGIRKAQAAALAITSNSSIHMVNGSTGTLGRRKVDTSGVYAIPSNITQIHGLLSTGGAWTPLALEKIEIELGFQPIFV